MPASSFRSAVTRSRSELVMGQAVRTARRRDELSRSYTRMTAAGEPDRVMVVGVVRVDDIVEDEARRGPQPGGWPGEAHGLGVVVRRDAGIEAVVREHDVDEAWRRVGDQRGDVRREVEPCRLALLGRDVAHVQTRRVAR